MQSIDVVKIGASVVLVMAGVRLAQTRISPDGNFGRALAFLFH